MTIEDNSPQLDRVKERYLEIAIPVASFGATLIGILLWRMGFEINFQFFAAGCLIGSCLLAYLAWIRPKKDIVALSTPIYAIIFFVVPTEYTVGITLQVLYAVSLTLLLIRLKYRFGMPGDAAAMGKQLANPIKIYIDQTRGSFTGVRPDTAHDAAVVFVQFAHGEYKEAARRAVAAAIGQMEEVGQEATIMRAFNIVKEHALLIDMSLPRPVSYEVFRPEESALLAKPPLPSHDEDHEFFIALDNALLLLFSVAWTNSEADRPHLMSCHTFVLKLFNA
ncbi:MAG: hypothetical protein Q7U51_03415 [Methanoregula sp.]|nr:hypothetical protein [Methanoregula sp.]